MKSNNTTENDGLGAYKLISPDSGIKHPQRFENSLDAIEAFDKTSCTAILTKGVKVIRYKYVRFKRKE